MIVVIVPVPYLEHGGNFHFQAECRYSQWVILYLTLLYFTFHSIRSLGACLEKLSLKTFFEHLKLAHSFVLKVYKHSGFPVFKLVYAPTPE